MQQGRAKSNVRAEKADRVTGARRKTGQAGGLFSSVLSDQRQKRFEQVAAGKKGAMDERGYKQDGRRRVYEGESPSCTRIRYLHGSEPRLESRRVTEKQCG